jgi:hypothetical protein
MGALLCSLLILYIFDLLYYNQSLAESVNIRQGIYIAIIADEAQKIDLRFHPCLLYFLMFFLSPFGCWVLMLIVGCFCWGLAV